VQEWLERSVLPSLGSMLRDRDAAPGVSAEKVDCRIEEGYARRL
jgi:hypothetical protein